MGVSMCEKCIHSKVCKKYADPFTFDILLSVGCDDFNAPTVEVVLIKEVKQKILETLDTLMATDAELASYDGENSYYRGKANAFEIARRLFNAALTDLAKMDGDGNVANE